MVNIRYASDGDLDRLREIYDHAREYMASYGNADQWKAGYPPREILAEDIKKQQLYVVEENGRVHGVFAFIIGADPTYSYIENGKWRDDSEYGTIHRIASDGEVKGIFQKVLDYCGSINKHIRIDTHENNAVMRHLILKNGFTECGIIYLDNGEPRIAYEKSSVISE